MRWSRENIHNISKQNGFHDYFQSWQRESNSHTMPAKPENKGFLGFCFDYFDYLIITQKGEIGYWVIPMTLYKAHLRYLSSIRIT